MAERRERQLPGAAIEYLLTWAKELIVMLE